MLLAIVAVLATWATISGCATSGFADDVSQSEVPTEDDGGHVTITLPLADNIDRGEVPTEGYQTTLRGLWPYYGENSDAQFFGILDIQEPCVYILEPDEGGDILLTAEGKPLRSFLMLPESLTRFNSATNQLWVGDSAPMTSGDYVAIGGGMHHEGKVPIEKTYEGICVAHSFIVASSVRRFATDLQRVYPQHRKVEARTLLKGLWPYDPKQDNATVEIFGTLVLEEPCVYIEPILDGQTQHTMEGEPVRSFVRLPDTRTFYNSTTNRIWTSETTPINNGDPVLIHGTISEVTDTQTYEDVCLAHSETTAITMGPWLGE